MPRIIALDDEKYAGANAFSELEQYDCKTIRNPGTEHMNARRLNKVAGWKNERIRLLRFCEIMYFYSEEKKTMICTADGTYEFKGSLNDLEQHLDEDLFFRSHRSYLINLDYVEYIDPWFNQAYTVKLKGIKEEIPVSRAAAKNLKRLIML